jgi:putative (di)nucleoside polyphosphate hydrolase
MMPLMPSFRPNVALILENAAAEILLGERSDVAGAWQFPQGGAKKGESPGETLVREMEEELSLPASAYEVLECRGPYRYIYPTGKIKEGFGGQEQTYFRARLRRPELLPAGPVHSPEFRAVRWIAPSAFDLRWVPPFKQEVYRQVFRDFWSIELALPEPATA